MKWSLRKKIVVPTCGLVIIVVLALGTLSLVMSRSLMMRVLNNQMDTICVSATTELERWIDIQRSNVLYWAANPSVIAAVNAGNSKDDLKTGVREDFRRIRKTYALESVFIADLDGTVAISDNETTEGKINVAERAYFKTALSGSLAISDVLASKTSGLPMVTLATPILVDNQVRGVLVSVLQLSTVSGQIIKPIKVFDSGYASLTDRNGQVIAHPNEKLIMKLKLQEFDWGREMIQKKNGSVDYVFGGETKRMIFRTSESLGWCMSINVPVSELKAPLKKMTITICGIGIGALLIGLLSALLIARAIANPMRNVATQLLSNAEQTAASASEISSASQNLASGASEQASSLEETSAALEEVSSTSKQNVDDARMASTLAREARDSAEMGAGNMSQMGEAMNGIKSSSDDIRKVVKTIDEIAFQTNILALNAAVEAARAGEAGAGFAVVADEVRTLAQRSAQAAKETARMVEDAITKTENGVLLSTSVKSSFHEIVEKIRKVDELVAQVSASSAQQGDGVSQVSTAVASMNVITQQNAATAEESAAASEELNNQAAMLKKTVADLTTMVDGGNASQG